MTDNARNEKNENEAPLPEAAITPEHEDALWRTQMNEPEDGPSQACTYRLSEVGQTLLDIISSEVEADDVGCVVVGLRELADYLEHFAQGPGRLVLPN